MDLRSQSGIDDLIRQEGLEQHLTELRSLSRMNVVDTLIAPVAAGAAAPMVPRPAVGALARRRAEPLREREYPVVGCDAYGALPDDALPYIPPKPHAVVLDGGAETPVLDGGAETPRHPPGIDGGAETPPDPPGSDGGAETPRTRRAAMGGPRPQGRRPSLPVTGRPGGRTHEARRRRARRGAGERGGRGRRGRQADDLLGAPGRAPGAPHPQHRRALPRLPRRVAVPRQDPRVPRAAVLQGLAGRGAAGRRDAQRPGAGRRRSSRTSSSR